MTVDMESLPEVLSFEIYKTLKIPTRKAVVMEYNGGVICVKLVRWRSLPTTRSDRPVTGSLTPT